jgi:hypothetical protein
MSCFRGLVGLASLASLVIFVSSSSSFAQEEHLDRHETRRIVRRVQERSDALQDRIDDWIDERPDERRHLAEELYHRFDRLDNAILTLRQQLIDHDNPWDLRDQARAVIDASRDVHEALDSADWMPHEVRHSWEDLRMEVNNLAAHYHLEPLG